MAPKKFTPVTLGGGSTERLHVFSTADGVEHTMPKEPPGSLTMEALELAAAKGEAVAVVWLMREVFGPEGYDALKAESTGTQLSAVMDIVSDHVMGPMEGK